MKTKEFMAKVRSLEFEIEIINWQAVHTDEPDNPQAGDIYDQAPYSREDYADAKAQGLDLDDWNDYQQYCRMGAWEDWEVTE